jgi:hypothetical protein
MFDDQQAKSFVKEVYKPIGRNGWKLLGYEFQRALLAEKCLSIVRGQRLREIEILVVQDLWTKMLYQAFKLGYLVH